MIDKTGASDFGGCLNIRRIAGSDNWSNHSWACALDLSPTTNGFNMKGTLSATVVNAFKKQGALWGGDYHGRDRSNALRIRQQIEDVMTIDPRVGFWLSVGLAIIGVLASSATQLTTLFGEHTTAIILALTTLLMTAGNAINAVLHAIPSKPGAASEFPLGPKT